LELEDPRHPNHDPRYRKLDPRELPATESLKSTLERVKPYWEDRIAPDLLAGQDVLVAAHGNSQRALAKMLEDISEKDIVEFNIPTGVPRIYEFDRSLRLIRAEYLGDADAIAAAARAVADQAKG
jgi:2,3-bisphosphoglycerate-dependent phosphoglycerate mutase